MNEDRRLRLRGAPIIHDTIDNETIVINQLTGAYYSLDGPSAVAWQLLDDGATAAAIVESLQRLYAADQATLAAAVDQLLDQLLAEELVVADTRADAAGEVDVESTASLAVGLLGDSRAETERQPFFGLAIQRYSDLEMLLLADPIHEVDESGWPSPVRRDG